MEEPLTEPETAGADLSTVEVFLRPLPSVGFGVGVVVGIKGGVGGWGCGWGSGKSSQRRIEWDGDDDQRTIK